ncbi:MAG: DUF956 family protein [Limosilactobacillus sp.]|nr:DUF956 family protein [Limosilactobacillus sp.]
MVESLNTKATVVVSGTSYLGLSSYGQIMVGDRGFEFYDERDRKNFIQIPWEEVDYVIAEVLFGGRWIPRYAIRTKKNGTYSFASSQPKVVLRAIREHVPAERMVKSLTFFQGIKRGLQALWQRRRHK